jgi:hypothetical protein
MPLPPDPAAASAHATQVALRTEILDQHRREWKAIRRVGWMLLTKALDPEADDDFRRKVVRILSLATKTLQEGETRVWGRDAAMQGRDAGLGQAERRPALRDIGDGKVVR